MGGIFSFLGGISTRGGRKGPAFVLATASLATYGAIAIAGILTAKILLPEEYAVKVLIFSIVNFALSVADLGIPFALVKEGGQLKSEGAAKKLFGKALLLNLYSCAIVYGLGIVPFILAARAYGLNSEAFIFILVASNIVHQGASIGRAYLYARKRISEAAVIILAFGAAYLVAVPLLTWLFGLAGLFSGILGVYALDAALSLKVAGIGNINLVKSFGDLKLFGKLERALISTGVASAVTSWISYTIQNYDNLLLGIFRTRADVAYYAVAYLPVFPMLVASNAIFSSVASDYLRSQKKDRLLLAKKVVAYAFPSSLLIGVLAVGAYWAITTFFLENYAPSFGILPWLVFPFAMESGINSPIVSLLVASGLRKKTVIARSFQLAVALFAGFFLIREYGIGGAVGAYWISSFAGAVSLYGMLGFLKS